MTRETILPVIAGFILVDGLFRKIDPVNQQPVYESVSSSPEISSSSFYDYYEETTIEIDLAIDGLEQVDPLLFAEAIDVTVDFPFELI